AAVAGAIVTVPEAEAALAAALGPILAARPAPQDIAAGEAAALLASGARGVLTAGRAGLSAAEQAALERRLAEAGLPRDAAVGWGNGLAHVDTAGDAAATICGALSTVLVLRDLDAAWQVHAILARLQDAAARCVVLATSDGLALLPNGLLHRPADEGAAALERTRELRRVEAEAQQAAETLQQVEAAALAAHDESRQRASAAETALHVLRAAEHERTARRGEITAAERTVAQ